MLNNLKDLKSKYAVNLSQDEIKQKIKHIYGEYMKRRQETILDAAAIAAGLSVEIIQERVDPQILEALRLQYPNLNIKEIPPENLQGVVNGVKGKYFEVLLRDKLNSGEWVGDLHLEEGQKAILAESSTQPGWDIKIVDSNGEVIELLQAKATDSVAYIKEHLERYPDIRVVATDEVAEKFVDQASSQVIDSDILDSVIENSTQEAIDEVSESFLEDFFDHFNPLIPFTMIVGSEGYRVIIGKYTLQKAINKSKSRVLKSIASSGVGAILAVLGFGIISIPSSAFVRFVIDRRKNMYFLSKLLKQYNVSLKRIALDYTT